MPNITFILPDESIKVVDAIEGESIMQAAIENEIEEIVATCGGSCSCATCHCIIDDAWIGKVGTADEDEREMMESTIEPVANSRLSCQITMTEELDGIVVHVPESEW
ncbi:2Fe-2S iron-sulfur cluster-binding protein [Alteromonas lipolytica]|uniref:(2Fe-2S)-binding protein n=1 Tax=Alteromonas lipolytica TaxID=1856405 RepID=A0A1E8FHS6_9ALTE|nr:2Fe-2S iron-sulfur cluster-binding protein [Alteromonas lipolytica]OFI35485.1 (2Fe-2S)-binding protein [Alteromonas lipolytica]GGF76658.1 (2Fe-2S) ferredoxin [Alteromonas lipolytica]